MEENVLPSVGLEAWMAPVVRSPTEKEARGGNRQKMSTTTFLLYICGRLQTRLVVVEGHVGHYAFEELGVYETEMNIDNDMGVWFYNTYREAPVLLNLLRQM